MASTPNTSKTKSQQTQKAPTHEELIVAVYEQLNSIENPNLLIKEANASIQSLTASISNLQQQLDNALDRIKMLENERLREFIWIKKVLTKVDVDKENLKDELQRRVGDLERDVHRLEATLVAIIKKGLTVIDTQPGGQSKERELANLQTEMGNDGIKITAPENKILVTETPASVTEQESLMEGFNQDKTLFDEDSDATVEVPETPHQTATVENIDTGNTFVLDPSPEGLDTGAPANSSKDSIAKAITAAPTPVRLSKKAQKRAKQRAAAAAVKEKGKAANKPTKLEAPPMVRATPTTPTESGLPTSIPSALPTAIPKPTAQLPHIVPPANLQMPSFPAETVPEETKITPASPLLKPLLSSPIFPAATSLSLLQSKLTSLEKSYLLHKDLTNKQLIDLRNQLSTITNECLDLNKGYLSLIDKHQKEQELALDPTKTTDPRRVAVDIEKGTIIGLDEKFMAISSDLISRLNSRLEILEKSLEKEAQAQLAEAQMQAKSGSETIATSTDFSRFVNAVCSEGGGIHERRRLAKEANEAIRHATRCIEERKAKRLVEAMRRSTVGNAATRERGKEGEGREMRDVGGSAKASKTREDPSSDMNEVVSVSEEEVRRIMDMARTVGRQWAREIPAAAGPGGNSVPGGRSGGGAGR